MLTGSTHPVLVAGGWFWCVLQAFTEVVEQHAFLDVQFCVSQAFGESWAGKRARIKAASAEGSEEGWDLVSIIVKSNDDMRQEVRGVAFWFTVVGVLEKTKKLSAEPPHVGDGTPWALNGFPYIDVIWTQAG